MDGGKQTGRMRKLLGNVGHMLAFGMKPPICSKNKFMYIDINSGVNFISWASQAPDTMRMFQCIGKIAENMGEDLSGDPQQEGMVIRSFVESHFIQSLFWDRNRKLIELGVSMNCSSRGT